MPCTWCNCMCNFQIMNWLWFFCGDFFFLENFLFVSLPMVQCWKIVRKKIEPKYFYICQDTGYFCQDIICIREDTGFLGKTFGNLLYAPSKWKEPKWDVDVIFLKANYSLKPIHQWYRGDNSWMIVINCVCFDEVQFDVEVLQFQQWCDVLVGAVLEGWRFKNWRSATMCDKMIFCTIRVT